MTVQAYKFKSRSIADLANLTFKEIFEQFKVDAESQRLYNSFHRITQQNYPEKSS